jgi:hypothetical protein
MKKPLSETHPELAAEWHPTRNGELTAEMVTSGLKKKVWWLGSCKHEWDASVGNRSGHGNGCPYCSGRKAISGVNDLATINPTLAMEWDNQKNYPQIASEVTSASSKKVWWTCKLDHSWQSTVSHRKNGNGCPFCSGKRVLPGFNDLASQNKALSSDWDIKKIIRSYRLKLLLALEKKCGGFVN